MKQAKLSNGTVVRCRPVPPYSVGAVIASVPKPEYPYRLLQSASGGEERLPSLEGTPEFHAYQVAMESYRSALATTIADFELEIGIVDWKLPGSKQYSSEPPDGWEVPAVLARYGISTSANPLERRTQFIKYELISNDNDAAAVEALINVKPTTASSVEAAAGPFDPNDE